MQNNIEEIHDDYAQSANTLFHFVTKIEYLETILKNKALVARYCLEDIDYLGIDFKEIAVLQKCFCDIPLPKLTKNFYLNAVKGKEDNSLFEISNEVQGVNTHPDFYGKFAIAFSKAWGEKNNLQPIQYINPDSQFAKSFQKNFTAALKEDNVLESYAEDMMYRLNFMKPLRGRMKRTGKKETIEFWKNFHDEQEWRYVPKYELLEKEQLSPILANPKALDFVKLVNEKLATEEYSNLWLKYDYDDIRYIIVPDKTARIEIINTIMQGINENNFINDERQKLNQQYVLISKILVLDEMRKDW